MFTPKVCDGKGTLRKRDVEGCGGTLRPLISDHNPKASELYCEKCHTSYYMSPEEIDMTRRTQPPPQQN